MTGCRSDGVGARRVVPVAEGARDRTRVAAVAAQPRAHRITACGSGATRHCRLLVGVGWRRRLLATATRTTTDPRAAWHLKQPVVAMASTPSGQGYWLVARNGAVFTFGDAKLHGSAASLHPTQPVVGIARTPTGNGYWIVLHNGNVFPFGDARSYGNTVNRNLAQPIVGIGADTFWTRLLARRRHRQRLPVRRREVLRLTRSQEPRAADRRDHGDSVGERLLARRSRRARLHLRRRALLRLAASAAGADAGRRNDADVDGAGLLARRRERQRLLVRQREVLRRRPRARPTSSGPRSRAGIRSRARAENNVVVSVLVDRSEREAHGPARDARSGPDCG